jgi:hypothetical protein
VVAPGEFVTKTREIAETVFAGAGASKIQTLTKTAKTRMIKK